MRMLFFFKQKTAYEMRISDWSSDVCSSDLGLHESDRRLAAMSEIPQNGSPGILLAHHLKKLKLPTFLREHEKLARHCAAENLDHTRFLLRLAELALKIGRASCRERVCQYVSISVVAVSLHKKQKTYKNK